MLRISRKTLLAVEAVLDVALNARPDPVQAKEITRRQGVPQRYLEQVMQQLVHENVLKGVRGPRGGYTLARERRKISVGDIVRVVDAMERGADEQTIAAPSETAVTAKVWAAAQKAMLAELDAVTIEALCREARARGEAAGREGPADFTI